MQKKLCGVHRLGACIHFLASYRSFFPSTFLLLSFCSYTSMALRRSGRVGCEWWYIEKSLSLCGEDRLSTCSLMSAFAKSSFLSSLTANSSGCQLPSCRTATKLD